MQVVNDAFYLAPARETAAEKKRINGDLFKQAEWFFLLYLIPPLAQLLENIYTQLCGADISSMKDRIKLFL